ncbi:MAG: type II toxin-antitoxin system RelE/ParE family toxin [Meiothermus sp.]|nr:type II toxin-antitoxin system RelE/ParE family toxin [Meiothermus sp.]
MARVLKRPQAEVDLLEIWSFISRADFETADRYLDWINSNLELLATQPLMGRARDELRPGLHSLPVGNYVIFYTPLEDGVRVERIVRGSRDLGKLFEEL